MSPSMSDGMEPDYRIFTNRSTRRPRREPVEGVERSGSNHLLVASGSESSETVAATPRTIPDLSSGSRDAKTEPEAREQAGPVFDDVERELIEILTRGPEPRETIDAAFHRKEGEIAAVFACLAPAQARAMSERLEAGLTTDTLSRHFTRLASARRKRLLAFLADLPRRAFAQRQP